MAKPGPEILLTNDDGIDEPGLAALYDALSDLGDVTTVAPSTNNSGVGRVLSMGRGVPLPVGGRTGSIDLDPPDYTYDIPFRDHEFGYEVDGTPVDCVLAAVSALDVDPDIVVSGCNPGPNAGTSVYGRSGTVSAAMEAAELGLPAIAVSSTETGDGRDDPSDYAVEAEFTAELAGFALDAQVFADADMLNVLVPPTTPDRVAVTEPAEPYDIDVTVTDDGEAFRFSHEYIQRIKDGRGLGGASGTDSHAISQGAASISPIRLPREPVDCPAVERFAESYEAGSTVSRTQSTAGE